MSTQITFRALGVHSRKYEIPIMQPPRGTIARIQNDSRLGAMPEGLYHVIHSEDNFMLGISGKSVCNFHDANEPTGYRLMQRQISGSGDRSGYL